LHWSGFQGGFHLEFLDADFEAEDLGYHVVVIEDEDIDGRRRKGGGNYLDRINRIFWMGWGEFVAAPHVGTRFYAGGKRGARGGGDLF
jgi:hypothetical protein